MNTATTTQRLIAAAAAIGTTFSIVWSLASLAYPQALPAAPAVQVAATGR